MTHPHSRSLRADPRLASDAGAIRSSGARLTLVRALRQQRLTRQQTTLAETFADAEQQERERVATLVHDVLGGLMVQLRLGFGIWRQTCTQAEDPIAERLSGLLGELSGTVRTLTAALAPPAWHEDFLTALEAIGLEAGLRSGLAVRVAAQGAGIFELPQAHRALVCRVVRELCLNVQKHAHARRVEIHPRLIDGWLSVEVRDDGAGFDPARAPAGGGFGLSSARLQLQAVGGVLEITSTPGHGTCAHVLLPVSTA